MSKRRYFLLRLFLLLASPLTLAQDRFSSSAHPDESRMPTGEDIAKAQTRARDAMARIPPGGAQQQHGAAAMPRIESLPKPAAPAPDIATLAEKYKTLGRAATANDRSPDLLVMVSLSMPREALERIADQAERAGATLVFRGLKGDSMTKMGTEIKTIVGNRNVSAVVHPPAFQQFSVTRVPAVVIARPEAGNVLDNGCSQAETFVKVSGDVSLDYALEYIERRSQTWAETARAFRSRIVRGIN